MGGVNYMGFFFKKKKMEKCNQTSRLVGHVGEEEEEEEGAHVSVTKQGGC